MNTIELEILKWSTHNPRSTIKHPRWFALSNRLLEDPDFFGFSDAEFKAWIYILSQASQKNSSVISINFKHAERVCGIKASVINSCLAKLAKAKCIQLRDHDMHTNVHAVITTEQDKTEQNKQNNTSNAKAFDDFYSKYPRKEKKKEARKRFDALVDSGTSSELVMKGLSNYLAKLAREKTDPKFFKLPTTFLGELPDNWITPEAGAVKPVNYSEMATTIWHCLSDGFGSEHGELMLLADKVGIEKLKELHRDDFRPAGIVPGLLKQAAEKAAS